MNNYCTYYAATLTIYNKDSRKVSDVSVASSLGQQAWFLYLGMVLFQSADCRKPQKLCLNDIIAFLATELCSVATVAKCFRPDQSSSSTRCSDKLFAESRRLC